SLGMARVSTDLQALALASPDGSGRRLDEPYRRALVGIYARLAATFEALCHERPARPPAAVAEPYATASDFTTDLEAIRTSLNEHRGEDLARGRLRTLCHAVQAFGFHLAAIDLRQNSDVHERVIGELAARAGEPIDYATATEEDRVAWLGAELGTPRPL